MPTERLFTGCRCSDIEIRKRPDGPTILAGYAAVFYRAEDPGTEFALWNGAVERIVPTAFDNAIASDDVRALFNHDPNNLLGRTKSGTLRLSVDKRGLRYEVDLPDTQLGRDTAKSAERGDLSGSSFAFSIRDGGSRWFTEGDNEVRELRNLELFDVSPVTFPAYKSTSVSARSEDVKMIREERESDKARLQREQEAELVLSRVDKIDVNESINRLDE